MRAATATASATASALPLPLPPWLPVPGDVGAVRATPPAADAAALGAGPLPDWATCSSIERRPPRWCGDDGCGGDSDDSDAGTPPLPPVNMDICGARGGECGTSGAVADAVLDGGNATGVAADECGADDAGVLATGNCGVRVPGDDEVVAAALLTESRIDRPLMAARACSMERIFAAVAASLAAGERGCDCD